MQVVRKASITRGNIRAFGRNNAHLYEILRNGAVIICRLIAKELLCEESAQTILYADDYLPTCNFRVHAS